MPFEYDLVNHQNKAENPPRHLDGKQESLLQVEDSNLLLDTWKPAEDGNGTILRFLDLGRLCTSPNPALCLDRMISRG